MKTVRNPLPVFRMFSGKKYKLWNSSYHVSEIKRDAKQYRKRGLLARVVSAPDPLAPKDTVYGVYVSGSIFNIRG